MLLDELRHLAADQAFELYDFYDEIKDTGGWEMTQGHGVWKRAVFFERGDEPSQKMDFVVRFCDDSAEVNEAYLV